MMEKLKIIIRIIIISFCMSLFFISTLFSYIFIFPVKNITEKIETVQYVQKLVDTNTRVLYCKLIYDDCKWKVIGKDGVMFNNSSNYEEVVLVGKLPKRASKAMCSEKNTFIFKGEYLGKKKMESDDGNIKYVKAFKVTTWKMKYPINRNTIEEGYPLNGLCMLEMLSSYYPEQCEVENDKIIRGKNGY